MEGFAGGLVLFVGSMNRGAGAQLGLCARVDQSSSAAAIRKRKEAA